MVFGNENKDNDNVMTNIRVSSHRIQCYYMARLCI